jgi:hypothetical protein
MTRLGQASVMTGYPTHTASAEAKTPPTCFASGAAWTAGRTGA